MYQKDFNSWNSIKAQIHAKERNIYIRKREIRWASLGINVGSEIDGKGESFTRPVLVLDIVGSHLTLVAPISTKLKNIPGYLQIDRKDSSISICIHQIRVISQKRILRRKGKVTHHQFQYIKNKIKQFYNL